MDLPSIARETLAIVERGGYASSAGQLVSVRATVAAAVSATRLYRPTDYDALPLAATPASAAPARVEVTTETTSEAGRRLVATEQVARVVALNFASAKNPGGGFLGGAKAQEEDLARGSALYECLLAQPEYYLANRRLGSLLYTDHIIYSPDVPFFRDERLRLLDAPFPLSIITAPAPNAGAIAAQSRALDDAGAIVATLERRALAVLLVAAANGHRCVILGAWGCGVFRNDAVAVAAAFARALADPRLRGAFDRVVFAVFDPGGRNLRAFERQFGAVPRF